MEREELKQEILKKIDETFADTDLINMDHETVILELCMEFIGIIATLQLATGWGYGTGEELLDSLTVNAKWDHDYTEQLLEKIRKLEA